MVRSPDARRRWMGAGFLGTAAVLLVAGLTVLKARLQQLPLVFVCYWSGCLLFTALTMVTALLDLRAIRRRSRQEHTELVKTAWLGIDGAEASEKRGVKGEDGKEPKA